MRTSIATCTALGLAFSLATVGCKKDKEGDGGAAKAGESAQGGAKAAPAKGPKKLTAPEFFKHYNSLEGMAVLDAYGDGVTVSGTVQRTIEEGDGSLVVWLDVEAGKWVSLGFTDKGQAAKDKGVKAGDSVTATCKVGGGMDNYIMNIDCVME
jgi:hypothetical protein